MPQIIQDGSVYMMLFDNGLVKIGSSINVNKRIRNLMNGNAARLLSVFVVDVKTYALMTEMELHKIFREKRRHGEFFDFSWKDWEEIAKYWEWPNEYINDTLGKINKFYKDGKFIGDLE